MIFNDLINHCVAKLEAYLKLHPDQLPLLKQEKEGWLEYQMSEWCAAEIKAEYGVDVWDTGFYFFIDLYATLDATLQPLED